ncbi:MAG: hypothetical protein M9905_19275 [Rhizobiaceae bacterium]|nr:hypothetical protein [Rhizobiaceae bacterium]
MSAQVATSASALLALIDDLLDQFQIRPGGSVSIPRAVAVRKLVENVAELLAARLWKNIGLGVHVGIEVPPPSRRSRSRQVLLNLLGNAIKVATTGGVSMTVRVRRDVQPTDHLPHRQNSGRGFAEDMGNSRSSSRPTDRRRASMAGRPRALDLEESASSMPWAEPSLMDSFRGRGRCSAPSRSRQARLTEALRSAPSSRTASR